MGFIIFSNKIEPRDKILKSLVAVAYTIGARFDLQESRLSIEEREEKDIDVIISKEHEGVNEYFIFGIHSLTEVEKTADLLDLEIGKHYGIVGTDHDKYPFLMYLIGKEYLKLNPEHIISANGDTFFTIRDFEKIEKEYFENWCYTVLPWQPKRS